MRIDILQACPLCKKKSYEVKKRRQMTQYCDDEKNYLVSCDECFEEDCEYWQERYDDLNADIMSGIMDGQRNG